MTDIKKLHRLFQKACDTRVRWESAWQDCYEYALPQRESAFNPTASPVSRLFDGTAPDAVDQLAALLLSELTPPWMRWFRLSAGTDLTPTEKDNVATTLDAISDTLQSHFDRSNLSLEIHQCYLDLITVGTACLLFEEAPVGSAAAFRFTAVPLSEIYLAEGVDGRMDVTFRQSQVDLETLQSRFPQAVFDDAFVKEHAEDKLTVIEAVIPAKRGGYQYTAYVSPDDQHDSANGFNPILKEAYFETSPFVSFRWLKAPGEVYGRSPVMKALPDIKTANKVVELILKNASIAVTGIWLAEDDGVLNPANVQLTPGTIIPKAIGSKGLTPLEAPGKFDVSQLIIDDLRKRIRHALLGDKLGEISDTKMTATEVRERSDEMTRILGATYGRLQTELLTPLIARAVSLLRKRGEIPEVFLDGHLLNITYQSPRSEKQAEDDINKALLWLSSVSKLGEAGLSCVNTAVFVKWLSDKLNMPEAMIQSHPLLSVGAVHND